MRLAQFFASGRFKHRERRSAPRHRLSADEMAQGIGQPAKRRERRLAAIGGDGVHAGLLRAVIILNILSILKRRGACGKKDNMLNCLDAQVRGARRTRDLRCRGCDDQADHRVWTAQPYFSRKSHARRRWHADGRIAAPLLASRGPCFRCDANPAPDPRPGRRFDPVPRRPGPSWPGLSPLHPSRRLTLLRPGRGGRHSVLLPWLEICRRRPVHRPALRTRQWRGHPPPGASALLSP